MSAESDERRKAPAAPAGHADAPAGFRSAPHAGVAPHAGAAPRAGRFAATAPRAGAGGAPESGRPAHPDAASGEDEKRERPLGSRAPAFIKARRPLHLTWQVGVFLIGLAVVVLGVILLPLPGPGWVVIFAGMAIWATEFIWAQLVLRWTKRKVTEAAQRALDPRVRRRNMILTAIGLVVIGALIAVYLWEFGFVMPWKIER